MGKILAFGRGFSQWESGICYAILYHKFLKKSMGQIAQVRGVRLTSREKEILNFITGGVPTRMIAQQLCISEHTIYNHRRSIIKKRGVRRITDIAVIT